MPEQRKEIQHQFEKLEEKKQHLMQLISSLPPERYLTQPHPTSWSVAQAANHIYMSESLSYAYLKKKLTYPETIPPFNLRSWGAVLLIKAVLFTQYKRKAPKMIDMWNQQPILSASDLEEKWTSMRKDLFSIIDTHQSAFGKHLVYKHPFAGRMTMHQMLIFLNDHMGHHIKQIQRIINTTSQTKP